MHDYLPGTWDALFELLYDAQHLAHILVADDKAGGHWYFAEAPDSRGSSSCGEGNSAAPIFLNEKYTISVPIILYFGGQSFSPFDHLPLMFFKCYTSLEQILCQFVSIEVKIFFLVDLIVDKFAISNVYSYRAIESSIIYLKANHERAAWPNYARRELTSFW